MNSIIVFACLFCLASAANQQETAKALIAAPNQFPYHVGMKLSLEFADVLCGGALINKEWIVTSANCLYRPYEAEVSVGTPNFNNFKYVKLSSEAFHLHPGFNASTLENDIALLKIPAVQFTDAIQPVALPNSDAPLDGQTVTSTGWGIPEPYSRDLVYANLNAASTCSNSEFKYKVTADKLCASTSDVWAPCHADNGGPLVMSSSKVLVGVYSFTEPRGCGRNAPIVYTRVAAHLEWIKKTAGMQ